MLLEFDKRLVIAEVGGRFELRLVDNDEVLDELEGRTGTELDEEMDVEGWGTRGNGVERIGG